MSDHQEEDDGIAALVTRERNCDADDWKPSGEESSSASPPTKTTKDDVALFDGQQQQEQQDAVDSESASSSIIEDQPEHTGNFLSKVRKNLGGGQHKKQSLPDKNIRVGELPNKKSLQEQAQSRPTEAVNIVQASGELKGAPNMSRKQRVSMHAKKRAAALKTGEATSPIQVKKRPSIVSKILHHGQHKHDKVHDSSAVEASTPEASEETTREGNGLLEDSSSEREHQNPSRPTKSRSRSPRSTSNSQRQLKDNTPQSPRRKSSERPSSSSKSRSRNERGDERKTSSSSRNHRDRRRRDERHNRDKGENSKSIDGKSSSLAVKEIPSKEGSDGDHSANDEDLQSITRNNNNFYLPPPPPKDETMDQNPKTNSHHKRLTKDGSTEKVEDIQRFSLADSMISEDATMIDDLSESEIQEASPWQPNFPVEDRNQGHVVHLEEVEEEYYKEKPNVGLGDVLSKGREMSLDTTDHSGGDSTMNETSAMISEVVSSVPAAKNSALPAVAENVSVSTTEDVESGVNNEEHDEIETTQPVESTGLEDSTQDNSAKSESSRIEKRMTEAQTQLANKDFTAKDESEERQFQEDTGDKASFDDEAPSETAGGVSFKTKDLSYQNDVNGAINQSSPAEDYHPPITEADNSNKLDANDDSCTDHSDKDDAEGGVSKIVPHEDKGENDHYADVPSTIASTPKRSNLLSSVVSDDIVTESVQGNPVDFSPQNRISLKKKVDDRRAVLTSMLEATNTKTMNAENELLDLKQKFALSQALVETLQVENDELRRKSLIDTSALQLKLLEQRHNREAELEKQIKHLLGERDNAVLENHDLRSIILNSCSSCRQRLPDKYFAMDRSIRNPILEKQRRKASSAFEWLQGNLAVEARETENIAATKTSEVGRSGNAEETDDVVSEYGSVTKSIRSRSSISEAPLNWISGKLFSSNNAHGRLEEKPSMINQVITYDNKSNDITNDNGTSGPKENGDNHDQSQKADGDDKKSQASKTRFFGSFLAGADGVTDRKENNKTKTQRKFPLFGSRVKEEPGVSEIDQDSEKADSLNLAAYDDEALKNLVMNALESSDDRAHPRPTDSWNSNGPGVSYKSGECKNDEIVTRRSPAVKGGTRSPKLGGAATLESPFSAENDVMSPRRRGATNRGRRGSELAAPLESYTGRIPVPDLDGSTGTMDSANGLPGKMDDDLLESRPWRSDTSTGNAISKVSIRGKETDDDNSVGGEDSDPLAALIEKETAEWNSNSQASLKS